MIYKTSNNAYAEVVFKYHFKWTNDDSAQHTIYLSKDKVKEIWFDNLLNYMPQKKNTLVTWVMITFLNGPHFLWYHDAVKFTLIFIALFLYKHYTLLGKTSR